MPPVPLFSCSPPVLSSIAVFHHLPPPPSSTAVLYLCPPLQSSIAVSTVVLHHCPPPPSSTAVLHRHSPSLSPLPSSTAVHHPPPPSSSTTLLHYSPAELYFSSLMSAFCFHSLFGSWREFVMIWLSSGGYQWRLKGRDDTMFVKQTNKQIPALPGSVRSSSHPAVFLFVLCLRGGRWRTRLDGPFFPLHEFG